MRLKARLEEVIADLHANPNLEVVDFSRHEMTTERLDKLEAKFGSLPEDYKAMLLEVGRVTVKWRSWSDPDIWGVVQLNGGNFVKKIQVSKDLFYMPDKGYFAVSLPMAKPDSTKARKSTRKLTESFEEAFEIVLNARGFHGWAPAYFGKWTGENREAKRHNPRPGLLQAALPALFDDFDLKDFGKAAKVAPATDLIPLDQSSAFDLSEEKAGLSYATRLQRQIQIIDQEASWRFFDVKFNPPATQEEIDSAQEAMGFELSESFLNYFRSCNGFQFSMVSVPYTRAEDDFTDEELRELWTTYRDSGGTYGSVEVIPIQDIFTEKAMPPMDGLDDEARFFGYVDGPLPDGHSLKTWDMLAVDLELSQANPHPVLRLATDYGADMTSRLPVDAITYFEWLLIRMCDYNDHTRLFEAKGYSVSEPIRQATAEELGHFKHPNDELYFHDDHSLTDEFWEK